MYLCIAELLGVPSELKINRTSSLSTSLRACSTAFGGLYASSYEMKLILRPLMPPSALIFLKYTSSVLPTTPYEDAGPLYGMMLPILISVSVAPVSYFFWAAALPLATAIATIAIGIARLSFVEDILFPLDFLTLVVDGLKIVRHLPCTVRHQEDDEEQKDAEHSAGETLGNSLRDVRHEDDEGGAYDRSGQPADAADHHAEEQRDARLIKSAQAIEKRRLTGAVRSDEPENLPLLHVERHAVQSDDAAEHNADVANRQQGRAPLRELCLHHLVSPERRAGPER